MLTRRGLFAGLSTAPFLIGRPHNTDARIREVRTFFEDYRYRAPYKFGGNSVDRVTLLNVDCVIESRAGNTAKGFGSMSMGNIWSWPSKVLTYAETLAAMKSLAARIATTIAGYHEYGHPLDWNLDLEPKWLEDAVATSKSLAEPIPKLCTLVTASPFEAAFHDAFGKLHNRSSYRIFSDDLLRNDATKYLGVEGRGISLDKTVQPVPTPVMAVYHSIGALDPLTTADIQKPIHDGLPETLPEWIRYNGLIHLKIKLNGGDLDWDVDRVVYIDRISTEVQRERAIADWAYSLDFNERAKNVAYLIEFMRRLKEQSPEGFRRVQYVEQPTARDLEADRSNVMHEAAKLKPVVIDESLTGLDMLLLCREMGYSGVALKACKGQSQAILMGAVAQKYKMFLCVQDLTCPGASLIHSAGLAAHIPGVAAIEANARQYVPAANAKWEARFPGIFKITNGLMRTSTLTGAGLGAV
jgi:L-alanine-DL-glutamate epimerase-like enolase superfamily enzyme